MSQITVLFKPKLIQNQIKMNIIPNLKIAFIFIKEHIFAIFFAILAIFVFLFAKNKQETINQLIKNQKTLSDQHKQEIEEIQKIKNEELNKRIEIEKHYQIVIDKINKDHQDAIQELSKTKEKEIKEIISETLDKPDQMASRINSMFGFPVYVKQENN